MSKHGNKLIADFIDYERCDDYSGPFFNGELMFDSSWDWLMPVIKKIRDYWNIKDERPYFKKSENEARAILSINVGTPIEKAYNAVIDFIEWYNAS